MTTRALVYGTRYDACVECQTFWILQFKLRKHELRCNYATLNFVIVEWCVLARQTASFLSYPPSFALSPSLNASSLIGLQITGNKIQPNAVRCIWLVQFHSSCIKGQRSLLILDIVQLVHTAHTQSTHSHAEYPHIHISNQRADFPQAAIQLLNCFSLGVCCRQIKTLTQSKEFADGKISQHIPKRNILRLKQT